MLHSSFGSLQQFVIDEESAPPIKPKIKIKKEPVDTYSDIVTERVIIPPVNSTNFTASVPDDWANVVVKDEYEEYEINEVQHFDYQPRQSIKEENVQHPEEVESKLVPEDPKLKLIKEDRSETCSSEELQIDEVVNDEHLESRLEEVEPEYLDTEELEIETILSHSNELVIKQSVKRRREREEAKKKRTSIIMNIHTAKEEIGYDKKQEKTSPKEADGSAKRWKITYDEEADNRKNAYAAWVDNRKRNQYKCEYCALLSR